MTLIELQSVSFMRTWHDKASLSDQILPNVPVHVGEADVPPGIEVGEFFVIETQLVEDGRPEIIDRCRLLDGMVTEIIGGPINRASLESPTRQPDRVAVWVVVAAIASL
jgi:hypothetical protein